MVKLLKRGKKEEASSPPSVESDAGAAEAPTVVDPAPAAEVAPATFSPPTDTMSAPPAYSPSNGGARAGRGGLFDRMYGSVGEETASERERQAAVDFQQAIAPALDLLQATVPEASSPDEAARIIEQHSQEYELVPDPNGGAFVRGDAFETDARVYYRLLRRNYEKTPRPSETSKRQMSPHLHQVYGKLTGNKGW